MSFIASIAGIISKEFRDKPEDFGSNEKYIQHLREKIKLEQEILVHTKESDGVHKKKGIGLLTDSIKEKIGVDVTEDFLLYINRNSLSPEETISVIESLRDSGYDSTAIFRRYMCNTLNEKDKNKLELIINKGLSGCNKV